MRLIIFMFMIVIAFVGYLAYLNPGDVTFYLAPESGFEVPTTALVLLSMAFGGLIVVLVTGFIETKHLFVTWRLARLKKKEERITGLLHEARNAKASRRHEEAVGLFEKVLQVDPHHVPTLLLLGDLYRGQGDPLKALHLHQTAKGSDKKNIDVLLSLSKDLEAANRIDEAIQTLEEILKVNKDCLTARIRVRELYIGLGQWEKAHEVQENILKEALPPEEANVQQSWLEGIKYETGRGLVEQGDPEKARDYFRGCIKLNKNFIPAYIGLGETLMAEGKTEEVGELWENAYQITGDVILLHRLEGLYLSTDQPSRVLQIYQEALQKDPANPILQFYLGKLYYRLEMVDEAVDTLNSIDLREGRMPDLHKLLGNLYLQKGELSAAIDGFKKALDLTKRVHVPYCCPSCDLHTTHWSGRCPRCEKWNTFMASPVISEKKVPEKTIKGA